jgi:hypothetical protein
MPHHFSNRTQRSLQPIIGRHGFARVVHTGGNAVALGATTSDTRFKGQKDALVTAAKSFRSAKVRSCALIAASPLPCVP